MLLKALINGIDGVIPGGISIKDFSMVAETNQVDAKKILEELIKNGIGKKENSVFEFSLGDRLKAGLYAIKEGASIDEVSEHLGWKDFEGLVAEILESKDFAAIRNLLLKNPRMEIDVVGIKSGIAVLIDCKHWKKSSRSAMRAVVSKQIERTKHYVSQTQGAMAVPVIVTLYQDQLDFIDKVPIVPIFQFSSFVDEFYGNLDELETIKSD
ncbi:MAG: restriction endonuclease [Nitrosopumilaceae archaeon]